MNFFEQVYQITKQIPAGKVATYGQIARLLGTRDARRVGHALHANKDPQTPCHRVVNKEGKLAKNFAFDGWEEQKRRLEAEGVAVVGNVDLEKYQCTLTKIGPVASFPHRPSSPVSTGVRARRRGSPFAPPSLRHL